MMQQKRQVANLFFGQLPGGDLSKEIMIVESGNKGVMRFPRGGEALAGRRVRTKEGSL